VIGHLFLLVVAIVTAALVLTTISSAAAVRSPARTDWRYLAGIGLETVFVLVGFAVVVLAASAVVPGR
jgi:hypothetical protein